MALDGAAALIAKRFDGETLAVDPALAKLLGYEYAEFVRMSWDRVAHPEDHGVIRRWVAELREGVDPSPMRIRAVGSDGSIHLFEVDAICSPDGEVFVAASRPLTVSPSADSPPATAGDLTIDRRARTAIAGDIELQLTVSEFELLALLAEKRGEVLRADEIANAIWGYETAGSANFLQAHVSRLRRKLRDAGVRDPITTIRGVGYVIR